MNQVPPFARSAPSAAMDTAYEAVIAAQRRTVDALAGFEKMVEKAEPAFRPVAERFRALHARHGEALSRLLLDAGHVPDTDGTFMSTVNRAVVATRAFFDKIDADVMAQVHSGEDHVVEAYRAALAEPLPAPERDVIAELLTELQTLLAETRRAV